MSASEPIIRIPRRRSGCGCLIPILLVAALLLVAVGVGSVAWILAGRPWPELSAKASGSADRKPASEPVLSSIDKELVAAIVTHPWWRVRVTEENIAKMAAAIVALNSNEWLLIGDDAGMEPGKTDDDPGGHTMRALLKTVGVEEGTICIFLDGRKYSRRLTHTEALQLFKRQLDTADFRRKKP